MESLLNQILHNARNGVGACAGCPAQNDTKGQFVNPGLLDPEARLMILTMDPSQFIDWDTYEDWSAYNDEKSQLFRNKWPGGNAIRKILDGIPDTSIDNIWLADAVKCPVNNDRAGDVNTNEAFAHCSKYLKDEIRDLAPEVIVTMGNDPAMQLLNGVFNRNISSIRGGSRDCGRIFDTDPPVVISPHWANGWLGRNNNRVKVREAILDVFMTS